MSTKKCDLCKQETKYGIIAVFSGKYGCPVCPTCAEALIRNAELLSVSIVEEMPKR